MNKFRRKRKRKDPVLGFFFYVNIKKKTQELDGKKKLFGGTCLFFSFCYRKEPNKKYNCASDRKKVLSSRT